MLRLISIALIFTFSITVAAQQKFIANLSGWQVVPPSGSAGKGVCLLTLDQTETSLSINCRYENLPGSATVAGVGFGAPVVSTVEDGASMGISLVAVFLPVLVIVVLVALAWLLIWLWLKVRRWRRRRRGPALAS